MTDLERMAWYKTGGYDVDARKIVSQPGESSNTTPRHRYERARTMKVWNITKNNDLLHIELHSCPRLTSTTLRFDISRKRAIELVSFLRKPGADDEPFSFCWWTSNPDEAVAFQSKGKRIYLSVGYAKSFATTLMFAVEKTSQDSETLTEKLTKTPEGMRLYQQERAIQELTDLICKVMQEQDVSRKELARRIGKTSGYITQLLDGRIDMTMRIISDVFTALDRSVHFQEAALSATAL